MVGSCKINYEGIKKIFLKDENLFRVWKKNVRGEKKQANSRRNNLFHTGLWVCFCFGQRLIKMSEIGARKGVPAMFCGWGAVLDSKLCLCSSTCVIAINFKMCSLFSQGKSLDMSLKTEERWVGAPMSFENQKRPLFSVHSIDLLG